MTCREEQTVKQTEEEKHTTEHEYISAEEFETPAM
jgi:hypothetical protein